LRTSDATAIAEAKPVGASGAPAVVGIDLGTSSLKISAYDADLSSVCTRCADVARFAGSSRGELDAGRLWRAVRDELRALSRQVDCTNVAALGIAGMAESGFLMDSDSEPITPMFLWHDHRGVRQAAALRKRAGAKFARITGLKTTSVRSLAKWMWMREHGAPLDARWCGAPEWVALCLTGTWMTDSTLAVRTGAFDVLKNTYSAELLRIARAPQGLFPPIGGLPATAGTVSATIARDLGIPDSARVVIAGHDDVVAAYGAGGRPGDLIDSAGTAEGLIRIVSTAPSPAETVRLSMALTRSYDSGTWALIAGVGSTGALMQQAASMLGFAPAALDRLAGGFDEVDEDLVEVRLSKNALPAIRIRAGAEPVAVWNAVLDLVCDRLEEAARRLEMLAGPHLRLLLMGGAARSEELRLRKSKRLGLIATTLTNVDATTRGAAALAARAVRLAARQANWS